MAIKCFFPIETVAYISKRDLFKQPNMIHKSFPMVKKIKQQYLKISNSLSNQH